MTRAAVVLDLSPNGLAIARNLARRGVPVTALDRPGNLERGRTRLARCLACPDPADAPDAFVDYMAGLGRSFAEPPVLFAAADDYVETLSRRREDLAPYYRFLLPPAGVVEALQDKRQTMELARHHGFPAPATWMIDDPGDAPGRAEARGLGPAPEARGLGPAPAPAGAGRLPPLDTLPYPCIVKPARSYRFRRALNRKALPARNPAELRAALDRVRGLGPVMIQELIPGGDDQIYQVGFVRTAGGRMLARFAGRKLLQYPPRFGSGALAVAEAAPDAVELATRIVETLDLPGICNVELKRDARDGRLKLMEIDPRLWLWHDLGRVAGVDLAWTYYRLLAGGDPSPRLSQRQDVKWVHEVRAPASAWAALRSGERSWRRLLADFRGIRCPALWAWDDPLPLWRFARSERRRRRAATPPSGGAAP